MASRIKVTNSRTNGNKNQTWILRIPPKIYFELLEIKNINALCNDAMKFTLTVEQRIRDKYPHKRILQFCLLSNLSTCPEYLHFYIGAAENHKTNIKPSISNLNLIRRAQQDLINYYIKCTPTETLRLYL